MRFHMRTVHHIGMRLALGLLTASVATSAASTFAQSGAQHGSQLQVLFVCEHGNVKSLMAASYFNRLARQRGLPFRAASRATAPDSTTVPPAIVAGLAADGFDVKTFRPTAVDSAAVSASRRVITIGTALPSGVKGAGAPVERWDDVPPASIDYNAARQSLTAHVEDLLDRLTGPNSKP